MKHFRLFFAAVLAVCMSACDGCGGGDEEDLTSYIKADVAKFSAAIAADSAAGRTPQIVDVRNATEYAAGHIPGAVNVDGTDAKTWQDDNGTFMKTLKSLFTTEQRIYIYGNAGTSGWSAYGMALPGRVANTWGKEKTYNLSEGYDGWVKAGKPIEK